MGSGASTKHQAYVLAPANKPEVLVVVSNLDMPFEAKPEFNSADYIEVEGWSWPENAGVPYSWWQAGFGPGAVADFTEHGFNIANEAKLWFDNGFGPVAAEQWKTHGFDLAGANIWATAGFTPSEADAKAVLGLGPVDAIVAGITHTLTGSEIRACRHQGRRASRRGAGDRQLSGLRCVHRLSRQLPADFVCEQCGVQKGIDAVDFTAVTPEAVVAALAEQSDVRRCGTRHFLRKR